MEIIEHETKRTLGATRAIWKFLRAVFTPKTESRDLAEALGRDPDLPVTSDDLTALRELQLARLCSLGIRRST